MNNVTQKESFNLKEEPQKENTERICYLGTKRGMVTIKGHGIADTTALKRYKEVYELFSIMENKLEKEILTDIDLSFIGLEALVKVIQEIDDFDASVKFFTDNISPRNFFYLVKDIDRQEFYLSSDRIYHEFLSNSDELKRINEYYNEFEEFIEETYMHQNSAIYAYIKGKDFMDKKKNWFFSNIGEALKSSDKKEKKIAFNVINEYYTEKLNCMASDRTKEETFYEVKAISENWKQLMKELKDNHYTIDYLYTSIS